MMLKMFQKNHPLGLQDKITVHKYAVLSDSQNLKYPSDHLPVYIEAIIEK